MKVYIAGAQKAGANIQTLIISRLQFDLNVLHETPNLRSMEPDLAKAQELILWAAHIVFVYPTRWGTIPALLKGFIDRVFTSGFAFEETEGGFGYEPFFSVLPSIILAGIPDYIADLAADKRTIAVQFGPKKAAEVALCVSVIAAVIVIAFTIMKIIPAVYNGILIGVIPHCILLTVLLARYSKKFGRPVRTDLLLIIALTYLMGFAVIPLVNLM